VSEKGKEANKRGDAKSDKYRQCCEMDDNQADTESAGATAGLGTL